MLFLGTILPDGERNIYSYREGQVISFSFGESICYFKYYTDKECADADKFLDDIERDLLDF